MPKWWDDFNDVPGGNALRYYLGPAYEPINALTQFGAQMLPGADMVDMYQSSGDLMASRTPGDALNNLGWLGAASLGMFVPGNAGMLRKELEDLPLFHGTPNADVASGKLPLKINPGGRTDFGNFGEAIYGTPKRFIADAYAQKDGVKGGVREFKAPLRNPLYIPVAGPEYTQEIDNLAKELGVTATPEWRGSGQRNPDFAREFREKALAAGYDGVVSLDADGKIGAEIAIFDEGSIR